MLLGVDVGGTFTDAVLFAGGRLLSAKVPTSHEDQSQGVLAAIAAVLGQAGAVPRDVHRLSHGMTVATNALLEGRGARTALIATEGFTDLVALGRQDRPELYRLCTARPSPLVPEERRFGVRERMTPDGPLRRLTAEEIERILDLLRRSEAQAAAIVLLHSYRHPEHELALGQAISACLPDVHVSLSHEVVGTFREYERAATTEVDAALTPLLGDYLRRLLRACRRDGLPEPAIMQSNGGLMDVASAASHAAHTVLSGPAAGAAAAAFLARAAGEPHVLCMDMGGTSCDICVVDDGAVQEQAAATIAGRPIALPMLAVHTVGAGGGSIAWRDPGGALRVGPASAGADPGPACYGRGGTSPTVTDANLLLGLLSIDSPLSGGVCLDHAAAERAIEGLGKQLGMDTLDCAEGIRRVAGAEMIGALRVVTVERGIDPRGYVLMAFGGAGPLHAAQVADELGIQRVLCPRHAGVLAALGLVVSERRCDVQRSVLLAGDALSCEAIAASSARLAEQARRDLGDAAASTRATYLLRYRGQAFELAVAGELGATPGQLRARFESLHEDRYGYRAPDQALELVTIRVTASSPGAQLDLQVDGGTRAQHRTSRRLRIDGRELLAEVLSCAPDSGTGVQGPAIVELGGSAAFLPPGWSGQADGSGSLWMERP